MLAVTADSNIWVSAFNSRGRPRLIDMADAGEITVHISEPIIAEVLRVLREKFECRRKRCKKPKPRIARSVTPEKAVDVVKEDPADNRILECAAEAKSDYLVTADKDLLRVRKFGNIPIVMVADFLDLAQVQEREP